MNECEILQCIKIIENKLTSIDNTVLLQSFYETRKIQAFFTDCLSEQISDRHKEILTLLIQVSALKAKIIKSAYKLNAYL